MKGLGSPLSGALLQINQRNRADGLVKNGYLSKQDTKKPIRS